MLYLDAVALAQGVHNARDNGHLSDEYHDKIVYGIINRLSFRSDNGRSILKYDEFIHEMAKNDNWLQMSILWRYLGHSISEAICVSNSCCSTLFW